ncbi:MAG: T9SS type A sorting domain-containing protein [Bacteroidota bacterium]
MKSVRLLPLLLLFHFQLSAQQATRLEVPKFQIPNQVTSRDGTCNFAGTFSLGQFIGQSNDISLDTIFLCLGDSIYINHNGDYDLSGDPNPATPPGIGWAFYNCPPSISGPDLNSILGDSCLLPGAANGIWVYAPDNSPSGNAWFYNQGQLQTAFGNGAPIGVWFAPITLDIHEGGNPGYESAQIGTPPGPCVNVNTNAAFEVVYLNPIQKTWSKNNYYDPCIGIFRTVGGFPEWDLTARYQVDIALDSDPFVKATIFTPAALALHGGDVVFSVAQPGIYSVQIEDGKSCGLQFTMDMSGCNSSGQLDIAAQSVQGHSGSVTCVPIVVQNFNNVLDFVFSLGWNPDELEFVNFQNVNPVFGPNFNLENVNLANVQDGKLAVLMYDNILLGTVYNIPDGESLFSACFNVINEPDSCSIVSITNNLSGILFESPVGDFIPAHVESGAICSAPPVTSISEPARSALNLRLIPNIISAGQTITYKIKTDESAVSNIRILDLTGRCLFTRTQDAVEQKIETQNLRPGLYWISVETAGKRDVKPLVVTE